MKLAEGLCGDDGVDDSSYNEGCHHGVGFDEECEGCDGEDEMALCDEGHEYDLLDGRCHTCGAHAAVQAEGSA